MVFSPSAMRRCISEAFLWQGLLSVTCWIRSKCLRFLFFLNCSKYFFLSFTFLCLFFLYISLHNSLLSDSLSVTSVFEEDTLKHSKHLSLFSLKWLIEIVFTKQAPSNKYIHPRIASKHTSYTGFSTLRNLTDAQLRSHMPVQKGTKNSTSPSVRVISASQSCGFSFNKSGLFSVKNTFC